MILIMSSHLSKSELKVFLFLTRAKNVTLCRQSAARVIQSVWRAHRTYLRGVTWIPGRVQILHLDLFYRETYPVSQSDHVVRKELLDLETIQGAVFRDRADFETSLLLKNVGTNCQIQMEDIRNSITNIKTSIAEEKNYEDEKRKKQEMIVTPSWLANVDAMCSEISTALNESRTHASGMLVSADSQCAYV